MPSELKIEILPDGTLKLNARKMVGSEKELLDALDDLAKYAGGELVVEKHEPGLHHHGEGDEVHHRHQK